MRAAFRAHLIGRRGQPLKLRKMDAVLLANGHAARVAALSKKVANAVETSGEFAGQDSGCAITPDEQSGAESSA